MNLLPINYLSNIYEFNRGDISVDITNNADEFPSILDFTWMGCDGLYYIYPFRNFPRFNHTSERGGGKLTYKIKM